MGDGNNTNGMKCSGATVGDIKSTKEGTFTVQQPSVGKICAQRGCLIGRPRLMVIAALRFRSLDVCCMNSRSSFSPPFPSLSVDAAEPARTCATARPQLAKADTAFQAHPLANRLNLA
jgi:hypothetical protein